jgi:hypothetical protein
MKFFSRSNIALVAGLVIAAPALAQAPQAQAPASLQKQKSQAQKHNTQDGNSPTTTRPSSGAHKQRTQGDLPEVGPASGAYNGNVPHSKY